MKQISTLLFLLANIYLNPPANATKVQCRAAVRGSEQVERQIRFLDSQLLKERILTRGTPGQYLTGFQPDAHGQLQPIWNNSPDFKSVRFVKSAGMFGETGWNYKRQARIIRLKIVEKDSLTPSTELLPQLPPEVTQLIQNNQIFETTNESFEPSFDRVNHLVESATDKDWHVLMMTAAPNEIEGMITPLGRTGILLHRGLPLAMVQDGEMEKVLEDKGIGLPNGGYSEAIRQSHGNISGGITEHSAQAEQRAAVALADISPVAVPGYVTFESPFGRQSQIFRWTPSTRRTSFDFNQGQSHLTASASELSGDLGRIIAEVIVRGFVPRLHMENLLASDSVANIGLTDFSDVHSLRSLLMKKDGASTIVDWLDVLVNQNSVHLDYKFVFENFLREMETLCDRLKLPVSQVNQMQLSQSLKTNPNLKWVTESYVRLSSEPMIQYVLERLIPSGIVKALELQNNPRSYERLRFTHGMDTKELMSKIENKIKQGRENYNTIAANAETISRELGTDRRRPDASESQILSEYQKLRTRNQLGWSLEGAKQYFKNEAFQSSYQTYLQTWSVKYSREMNLKSSLEKGNIISIEKLDEFNGIIKRQKEIIMKLDLLWFSFSQMGLPETAKDYREELEQVLNMNPLDFLINYESPFITTDHIEKVYQRLIRVDNWTGKPLPDFFRNRQRSMVKLFDPEYLQMGQYIYDRLNDPESFRNFLSDLEKTIPRLQSPEGERLNEINPKFILKEILAQHGFTFEESSSMSGTDFFRRMGEGTITEETAPHLLENGHGQMTHLLQLAYLATLVDKYFGEHSLLKLFKYMGTHKTSTWAKLFDSPNTDHLGYPLVIDRILKILEWE